MIKIFEFLWHGCWHKWVYESSATVRYHDNGDRYTAAVYKCSKCTRIQARKMV